jgi:hypothetical protein
MSGESIIQKDESDITHMSMDNQWLEDTDSDEDFVEDGESDDSDNEEVAAIAIDRRSFLEEGEDPKMWIPPHVKGAALYNPPILTGQNNVSEDGTLSAEEISLIGILFANQSEKIESFKNAKSVMNSSDYIKTNDHS